jgi:hypothetical protein
MGLGTRTYPHPNSDPINKKNSEIWQISEFSFLETFRHVLAPHASQRIADLAEGDVIFHAFDEERHQVVGAFA